jgi:tetratricopeptide (TPR) repeat protein
MSTKKNVVAYLEEVRKVKLQNNKKILKDVLVKGKEKFSDVPVPLILEGEINLMENKIGQAYDTLKEAIKTSTNNENKEYLKVASFFFAKANFQLGKTEEAEKILLDLKEESTKDELSVALRKTWPTFYVQTFGLLGQISFEKNEIPQVQKNLKEVQTKLKELVEIQKMDKKSIFEAQQYLLLEVDILLKEK